MKRTKTIIAIIISVVVTHVVSAQQYNSLTPSPPMGWNSWNWFGKNEVNEQVMKQCMDAIVELGLLDAGYEYFVIDGGWRDTKLGANGELLAHPEKFPNGIKALADYAHSRGLKFGLHTVPGTHDCGGDLVGGYGHEEVQVKQFVDWGLDFIKLDRCRFDGNWNESVFERSYKKWSQLLKNCGRDIVLSISAHPPRTEWCSWYPEIANMARTTDDIKARVSNGASFDQGHRSVMEIANKNNEYAEYAGNGYWNDPDILSVGNQGLTIEEQKVHFALWCIMSAPLILGNDPRIMTDEVKEIVINNELIAVNQDPLGNQGRKIRDDGDLEVWSKELSENRQAIILLNRSSEPANIKITWKELGLEGKLKVRDLWEHKNLGRFNKEFTGKNIPSHEALVLLIK